MVQRAFSLTSIVFMSTALAYAAGEKVPAGETIHCRLSQTLSTLVNSSGDVFNATVSEPVVIGGNTMVPAGAVLEGRIERLAKPGRIKGAGQMLLSAERLRLSDGRAIQVAAILVGESGAEGVKVTGDAGNLRGPTSRLRTLLETSGGAAAGGLLGALAGHTVWGMAIGGAAGFVNTVRHRGKPLSLPAGTGLEFELTEAIALP